MKIAFIAPPLSMLGGWTYYAEGIINAAATVPENEVTVLTSTDYPGGLAERALVYPVLPPDVQFRLFDQLIVWFHAMRVLKGVNVLHVSYELPMIGAALAARMRSIPLVITLHGTYALPPSGNSLKERIKRGLMRFVYKTAAITTTGSFNTEQRVREIIAELPECRFIPNGVDTNTFYRKPDIAHGWTLLSVGALKPRKGFDTVIEALGLLKDEFPYMNLLIICGDTNDPTAEYYKYLESKMQEAGVVGRVAIEGNKTREQLAEAYNSCGVFLLTSRDSGGHFEGFPMVYMEAFACGAPIVTTRGYGSEYAILPGENGFLVNQDDPEETAHAIRTIMSDAALRTKMEAGALAQAARHSWKIITPQLMKLYEDAQANHQRKN